MEDLIIKLEFLGLIFISILGTLQHFFYEWSNRLTLVGIFSPINESVWEHMKLILWPALLYSLFEGAYLKGIPVGFYTARLLGICSAIIVIIAMFYSYTHFSHSSMLLLDILSFNIGIVVCQLIGCKIIPSNNISLLQDRLSYIGLIFLIIIFIIFTFCPPRVSLFKDPRNGTYGLQNKSAP